MRERVPFVKANPAAGIQQQVECLEEQRPLLLPRSPPCCCRRRLNQYPTHHLRPNFVFLRRTSANKPPLQRPRSQTTYRHPLQPQISLRRPIQVLLHRTPIPRLLGLQHHHHHFDELLNHPHQVIPLNHPQRKEPLPHQQASKIALLSRQWRTGKPRQAKLLQSS